MDKMEKCLLNWSECVGKSFDSIYGEVYIYIMMWVLVSLYSLMNMYNSVCSSLSLAY